jgi:DNA-binding transcriptional regulator WhiA
MAPSDRDLVAAIRAELAAIDPSRPCDRAAESAGLGPILATREPALVRLAIRLGAEPIPTHPDRIPTATRRFRFDSPDLDWAVAPEHCRLAWLRGRFLARGSLSVATGRTHLEFVVPLEEAAGLAERLAPLGTPPGVRSRRGLGVVTWKGTDVVATFLRRLGARGALLELEARAVARALRGDLNRVLNAESANLQRSVAAAGRQLAAIDELDGDGRLARQPYVVRSVAEARREHPDASLTDIAVRLGIHRSAVQRALDRLETLVLHPDGGVGRRGGSPSA